MSGNYVSSMRTFRALFWRMLWKAGVPMETATEEDLEAIVQGYNALTMRPGAKECIQKLRDAGFTVWCFTMGSLEGVGGYFKQAGIDLPAENLLSCDSSGIGKPAPEAYRPLLKQLSADGSRPWFAAAHMWDASAAKRTGCVMAVLTTCSANVEQFPRSVLHCLGAGSTDGAVWRHGRDRGHAA